MDNIKYYFEQVITANPNWLLTDKIIAMPDCPEYTHLCYENGELLSYVLTDQEYEEIYTSVPEEVGVVPTNYCTKSLLDCIMDDD